MRTRLPIPSLLRRSPSPSRSRCASRVLFPPSHRRSNVPDLAHPRTPSDPPSPLPPAQSLTRLVADSPPPEVPDGEDPPEPSPPEPVRVEFLFPGEEAPTSFDPAVPSDDGIVVFDGVEASFEREPGAALVTQLVNNPLVITVHRGETKLATCTVDLTPFAAGASVAGGEAHPPRARSLPSRRSPRRRRGSPRAAPGQSSPPRRHHARHRRALGDVRLPRGRRGAVA